MPRPRRILHLFFQIASYCLAALSLLIFLSASVLWARSYWRRDVVTVQKWGATPPTRRIGNFIYFDPAPAYMSLGIASARGRFFFGFQRPRQASNVVSQHTSWRTHNQYSTGYTWLYLGFLYLEEGATAHVYPIKIVGIPYWFIMLVSALPWLRWSYVVKNRRRKAWLMKSGCCLVCGYDLRATPDRCPECGTVPAQKAAKPNEG